MSIETTPCVPGLFGELDGRAVLHGSRCAGCNTPYFPRAATCHNPDCGESRVEDCSFGGAGVLWSFSVADFPPPPPHRFDKPFVPYAIGVVDLDCGVRLIGQMTDAPDALRVGARVELVIGALYHEEERTYTSWKFRQIAAAAAGGN